MFRLASGHAPVIWEDYSDPVGDMPLHLPQVSPVTSNTGTRHVQPETFRLLFFARVLPAFCPGLARVLPGSGPGLARDLPAIGWNQRAGTLATGDGPLRPL